MTKSIELVSAWARLKRSYYVAEAGLLGAFMLSASAFAAVFEHPSSPLFSAIHSTFIRRAWVGIFMGLTAVCLIYSPWGNAAGLT